MDTKIYRIAHLTTAHPRYDTRIYLKQCRSLTLAGHEVILVVADGLGNEVSNGITIIDVGKVGNRISRMAFATRRVHTLALSLNVDLFHLHDPELLMVGMRLIRSGRRVIFDSHENTHLQLLAKPYLNKTLKRIASQAYRHFEKVICTRYSGIVAATPSIRDRFLRINPRTIDVRNYPTTEETANCSQIVKAQGSRVCYAGGISKERGITELLHAIELFRGSVTLDLCGQFYDLEFEEKVKALKGWKYTAYHGYLDRVSIRECYRASAIGLVTLHPTPNHLEALPIKMFEYMAAGLPVVASNFPVWRDVIEGRQCGICVDPQDPQDISEALRTILNNPDLAVNMAKNGLRAISREFNWPIEFNKLLEFYPTILSGNQATKFAKESRAANSLPKQ